MRDKYKYFNSFWTLITSFGFIDPLEMYFVVFIVGLQRNISNKENNKKQIEIL